MNAGAVGTPPGFSGYVEIATGFAPRPHVSHVVFDFDGTLSLIREGWPVIMLGMFEEMLPPSPNELFSFRKSSFEIVWQ